MRELLILGSKISRFYAAILKKVRHFIHRNDNIAPYSFQLFAKTIQEVVVAQFSDFTKFWGFGISWSLQNVISAMNIQEVSVTSLTNLGHYFVIPCSEFHKIDKKANHLHSHFSSHNIWRDYDLLKLFDVVSKVDQRSV